ncbi:TetR family transcriptional regulator [Clostridioides difficile]|nr:TetR family transcriptional regulator [Clostridioides difficile]
MNTHIEDRRVRKTKKALCEALSELLIEKDIQKISIRELTDKADIHRATFYVHYKDIYDLYEQIEDATLQSLGGIIRKDPSHSYDQILEDLIDYVFENAKIMRMFLNRNTKYSFYTRLNTFLEAKYFELWRFEVGERKVLSEEWNFLVRYHIQGFLAVLALWAENNFMLPKDKILHIVLKLDTNFDRLVF